MVRLIIAVIEVVARGLPSGEPVAHGQPGLGGSRLLGRALRKPRPPGGSRSTFDPSPWALDWFRAPGATWG